VFDPTIGPLGFSVSPGQIRELINEPHAYRIRLKVAIPNRKGDKQDVKSVTFYHSGTVINASGISCAQCDNSMTVLYGLLEKVRQGR
jgi:hypothetical protein